MDRVQYRYDERKRKKTVLFWNGGMADRARLTTNLLSCRGSRNFVVPAVYIEFFGMEAQRCCCRHPAQAEIECGRENREENLSGITMAM